MERVAEGERSAVTYYNSHIAREGNRQLGGVRGSFHHLRHQWGSWLVVGSAVAVAAVSLPYGRFTAVRNCALTALTVGWLSFPATVTGLLVASTESIQSAPALAPAWTRKGEQTVREAGAHLDAQHSRDRDRAAAPRG